MQSLLSFDFALARVAKVSQRVALIALCAAWLPARAAQPQASLVINDVTIAESNGGSAVARFTVSYTDTAAHGAALIFVSTSGGTAAGAGSCRAAADYVSFNNRSFTLTGAQLQIDIPVCLDARDEPDETFLVTLTARGAAVQDGQGQATIVDDDPPPTISISDVTVSEGAPGAISNAMFSITRSGMSDNQVSVTYATVNGSALGGSCSAPGADYESASGSVPIQNVTLQSQSVTVLMNIRVCGDNVSEGDQQFEVRLSNASNATIQDGVGVVSITDDEPLPTLSVTQAVQVNEPNALAPKVEAVFTVTLSGPPTEQPVSVQYSTTPGTALSGTSCTPTPQDPRPGDYISQKGTLTFTVRTAQSIRVPICGDSIPNEFGETFSITLTRAGNAAIKQGVGTATIN